MNKSQQMRWSRNGADLLLQVRCAVYNGTLGAGLGIDLPGSPMPIWPLPKRHDSPISGRFWDAVTGELLQGLLEGGDGLGEMGGAAFALDQTYERVAQVALSPGLL
jgi:hypothetical protein